MNTGTDVVNVTLTILKYTGTAIGGIAGIWGTFKETRDETTKRLTSWGKCALILAVIGFGVAIGSQILEQVKNAHDKRVATAEAAASEQALKDQITALTETNKINDAILQNIGTNTLAEIHRALDILNNQTIAASNILNRIDTNSIVAKEAATDARTASANALTVLEQTSTILTAARSSATAAEKAAENSATASTSALAVLSGVNTNVLLSAETLVGTRDILNDTREITSVATQTLSRIEHMFSRFETFQISATYEILDGNSVLKPLLTEVGKVKPHDTNGLELTYVAATTNMPAEVTVQIDAICANKMKSQAAVTNFLLSLKDPEMVVDIFKERFNEDDKAPLVFSTFDSGLVANPRVSCPVDGEAKGRLFVEWQVNFPKNAWYQTRFLTTAADVQNSSLHIGFVKESQALFAKLRPVSVIATFDNDDLLLTNFTTVSDKAVKLTQQKKSKIVERKLKIGGNTVKVKAKVQEIVSRPVVINARQDPARGFIVGTYQMKATINSNETAGALNANEPN